MGSLRLTIKISLIYIFGGLSSGGTPLSQLKIPTINKPYSEGMIIRYFQLAEAKMIGFILVF